MGIMSRILAIGIATLDIINSVDGFPAEDAEVRAVAQRVCRGGNAANTLVVLSQLGHVGCWAGVRVADSHGEMIAADLARYAIDITPCQVLAQGASPVSYVTLNRHNGSRTIVHYRDLAEYRYHDFATLDLGSYDWLHFEGRNVQDTVRMLERARRDAPAIPRSVEIEKPREGIEALFGVADLLLFSREYASHQGHDSPRKLLRVVREQGYAAELICTWGAAGALGLDRHGNWHQGPAMVPPQVVDTLGAGDCFNAGVIHAYLQGLSMKDVLPRACALAGAKCGLSGLDGLNVSMFDSLRGDADE